MVSVKQCVRLERKVAAIFDEMKDNYDDVTDLWYSWLFSRLHYFIATYLLAERQWLSKSVLDIGCGTGFQSFLYAAVGAEVVGIDLSEGLMKVAVQKMLRFERKVPLQLFRPYYDFVTRYNECMSRLLKTKIRNGRMSAIQFVRADATDLPFRGEEFDHVNCAGSTLSFVGDYKAAIREMSRLLRGGGTFCVEVEGKYNLDLVWTAVDAVTGGFLGYDTSLKESLSALFSKPMDHIRIPYAFGDKDNTVEMELRLYVVRALKREFEESGLLVTRTLSIHSLTNVIPSTMLDESRPAGWMIPLFRVLSAAEERIPFRLPGCSVVLIGQKIS